MADPGFPRWERQAIIYPFSAKHCMKMKTTGPRGGRLLPLLTKAPIQKSTNVNILAVYIVEKIQTILNPDNYEFSLYKTLIYFRKY